MTRRGASRKVVLSTAFLALAAGGTAACDTPADDGWESFDETTVSSDAGGLRDGPFDAGGYDDDSSDDVSDPAAGDEEVFYCADDDGEIVDDEYCDADDGTSSFFLWHSGGYTRGLPPGTVLDDGEYFPAGDREARRAYGLPATGRITNGTIKTNVVGRSSGGASDGGYSAGG